MRELSVGSNEIVKDVVTLTNITNEIKTGSSEINTIMPATDANKIPNTISFRIEKSRAYPMIAPTGSASPERNEYRKAFFLFPVAYRFESIYSSLWFSRFVNY